jgi:hypothetical protein
MNSHHTLMHRVIQRAYADTRLFDNIRFIFYKLRSVCHLTNDQFG